MATKKNSTLKNVLLAGAIGIGGLAIYGALKGNAIPTTSAEALTNGNSLIPSVWNRVQLEKDNKALAREYTNAAMDLMSAQTGGLSDLLKNFPLFPLVDLLIYNKAQEGVRDGTLKADEPKETVPKETIPAPTNSGGNVINLQYTKVGKDTAEGLGVPYAGGAGEFLGNLPGVGKGLSKVSSLLKDATTIGANPLAFAGGVKDLEDLQNTGKTKSGSNKRAAATLSTLNRLNLVK